MVRDLRVTACLPYCFFFWLGNCNWRCIGDLHIYEFSISWQSVSLFNWWIDQTYTDIFCNINSTMICFMESKLSEMWNIIMAFECPSLCVFLLSLRLGIRLCLNCASNILNGVEDFCKSSIEHYDDLGGSPTLCLLFVTMLNHWWWPVRQDKWGNEYRLTCCM
jgi:hypothetical protein